jgi:pilus assembly protein Flp/PilA
MRGNNKTPTDDVNRSEQYAEQFNGEKPAKNENGATATEYALLLGLLAIGLMASLSAFGGVLSNMMQGLANTVGGWA